jgi:DNA-binding winged helix-turn-helix (wHTH) protein/Tol biopolymer transport system component
MSATPAPPVSAVGKFRFGVFEADPQTGELRKSGIRIRMQSQPFQILQLLLERSGEVVSREEIQRKLWEQNTIIDLDQSLATAIHKIRVCLGDSVTQPRYIETLARNGYRFIAPVTILDVEHPAPDATATERDSFQSAPVTAIPGAALAKEQEPSSTTVPSTLVSLPASLPSRPIALILGFCISLLIAGAYFAGVHTSPPAAPITRIVPITSSGKAAPAETGLEGFSEMATDGSRVYFPVISAGRVELAEVAAAGGDTAPVGLPAELGEPSLEDLSPDEFRLLLRNRHSTVPEHPLWIASTTGQAAHQIPGVLAHAAAWMPSGNEIVYANGDDLWLAHDDGTANRKLVTLPGRAFWIRWSPGGKQLRFTLMEDRSLTTSLWEAAADGSGPHPLLHDWNPQAATCCGSWTADERYFAFQATTAGRGSLWFLPASSALSGVNGRPVLIADGPLSYESPTPSHAGHDLFFLGVDNKTEMIQLGRDGRGGLQPASAAFHNASGVEFSRDSAWVAWISSDDGSLWRSRSDGTERLQLVGAPFEVRSMRWSRGGPQLVLMARKTGTPWAVYIADAQTGHLETVLSDTRSTAYPDWSPDGKSIIFGRMPASMGETSQPSSTLSLLSLTTHTLTTVPGSEDLVHPLWSPNGKRMLALSADQTTLMLYAANTQTWRVALRGHFDAPAWSTDNQFIFFRDSIQPGQPLLRLKVEDGMIERLADLNTLKIADAMDYQFVGLLPGDVPLVKARLSAADLYSRHLPD